MEYRCVKCGFPIKTLFVQYSPGNIRLMKCENCKAVADEYIECEFMIILIDLILHKPQAYRHLLYNVLFQETAKFQGLLWKSSFGFLVLDAYRSLLSEGNKEQWGSSISFVWISQKVFVDVFVANFLFLCIFLLAMKIFLKSVVGVSRIVSAKKNGQTSGLSVVMSNMIYMLLLKEFCLAMIVSSYFKIGLIAMMVWEFPPSVVSVIDLFVLSSNIVALQVICESAMNRCTWACLCAHAVKLLAPRLPNLFSLR